MTAAPESAAGVDLQTVGPRPRGPPRPVGPCDEDRRPRTSRGVLRVNRGSSVFQITCPGYELAEVDVVPTKLEVDDASHGFPLVSFPSWRMANTRPPCSSSRLRSPSKTMPSPARSGRSSRTRTRPRWHGDHGTHPNSSLRRSITRHQQLVVASLQPAGGETTRERKLQFLHRVCPSTGTRARVPLRPAPRDNGG